MISQAQAVIAAAMTERELRDYVVDAARKLGWLEYHTWASIHSPAGCPDLILCRWNAYRGRLLFAELKSAKGMISPAQEAWLAALRSVRKVEVYLWRPADWVSGAIAEVLR